MPTVNVFYKELPDNFRQTLIALRGFVAETLSNENRTLSPEEVGIRVYEMGPFDMPVAPLEIEIVAHPYPDRVRRQDKICVSVVDFLSAQNPKLQGQCHAWLQLIELGHSWDARPVVHSRPAFFSPSATVGEPKPQ